MNTRDRGEGECEYCGGSRPAAPAGSDGFARPDRRLVRGQGFGGGAQAHRLRLARGKLIAALEPQNPDNVSYPRDELGDEQGSVVFSPEKRDGIMREMTASGELGPTFEAPDLTLASFLFCRSFPFLDIRRSGDGTPVVIFGDSPALRIAIIDFTNDGVVPVRSFFNTLRDLGAITR